MEANLYSDLHDNVDGIIRKLAPLFTEEEWSDDEEGFGNEQDSEGNNNRLMKEAISEGMAAFNAAYGSIRFSDRIELLSAANRWLEEKVKTFLLDMPEVVVSDVISDSSQTEDDDAGVGAVEREKHEAMINEQIRLETQHIVDASEHSKAEYTSSLSELKEKYAQTLRLGELEKRREKQGLEESNREKEKELKASLQESRAIVLERKKYLMKLERLTGPAKWSIPVETMEGDSTLRYGAALDAVTTLRTKLAERLERQAEDRAALSKDTLDFEGSMEECHAALRELLKFRSGAIETPSANSSSAISTPQQQRLLEKLAADYQGIEDARGKRENALKIAKNTQLFDPIDVGEGEDEGQEQKKNISTMIQVRAFHAKQKDNYNYLKSMDMVLSDDFAITKRRLSERKKQAEEGTRSISARLSSAIGALSRERKLKMPPPEVNPVIGGETYPNGRFPSVPPSYRGKTPGATQQISESDKEVEHDRPLLSAAAIGCYGAIFSSKGNLLIKGGAISKTPASESPSPKRRRRTTHSSGLKKTSTTSLKKKSIRKGGGYHGGNQLEPEDMFEMPSIIKVVLFAIDRFPVLLDKQGSLTWAAMKTEFLQVCRECRALPGPDTKHMVRSVCARIVVAALEDSYQLVISKNTLARFAGILINSLAVAAAILNSTTLRTLPDYAHKPISYLQETDLDHFCVKVVAVILDGLSERSIHSDQSLDDEERGLNASAVVETLSGLLTLDLKWSHRAGDNLELLEPLLAAEIDRRAVSKRAKQSNADDDNSGGWSFVGLDDIDAHNSGDERTFIKSRRLLILAFEAFLCTLGSTDSNLTKRAESILGKLSRQELSDVDSVGEEFPAILDLEYLSTAVIGPLVPVLLSLGYLRKLLCESLSVSKFVSDIRSNTGNLDEIQYLNDDKYRDLFTHPKEVSARAVAAALPSTSISEGELEVTVLAPIPAPPAEALSTHGTNILRQSRLSLHSRKEDAVLVWFNDILEQVEALKNKISDRVWNDKGEAGWSLPESLKNEVLGLSDYIGTLALKQVKEGQEGIERLKGAVEEVISRIGLVTTKAEDVMDAFGEGLRRDLRRMTVVQINAKTKLDDLKVSSKSEAEYLFMRGKIVNLHIDKIGGFSDDDISVEEPDLEAKQLLENPDDDGGMEKLVALCTQIYKLRNKLRPIIERIREERELYKTYREELKTIREKQKKETEQEDVEEDELLELFIEDAEKATEEHIKEEPDATNSFGVLSNLMSHKAFRLRLQRNMGLTASNLRRKKEKERSRYLVEEDSITGETRIVKNEIQSKDRFILDHESVPELLHGRDEFERALRAEEQKRKNEFERISHMTLELAGHTVSSPLASKSSTQPTDEANPSLEPTGPVTQRNPASSVPFAFNQETKNNTGMTKDFDQWVSAVVKKSVGSPMKHMPEQSVSTPVRLPVLGETFAPPSIDLSSYDADTMPKSIAVDAVRRVPTEQAVDHRVPSVIVRIPRKPIAAPCDTSGCIPVDPPSDVVVNALSGKEQEYERLTMTKYATEFTRIASDNERVDEAPSDEEPLAKTSLSDLIIADEDGDAREVPPVYANIHEGALAYPVATTPVVDDDDDDGDDDEEDIHEKIVVGRAAMDTVSDQTPLATSSRTHIITGVVELPSVEDPSSSRTQAVVEENSAKMGASLLAQSGTFSMSALVSATRQPLTDKTANHHLLPVGLVLDDREIVQTNVQGSLLSAISIKAIQKGRVRKKATMGKVIDVQQNPLAEIPKDTHHQVSSSDTDSDEYDGSVPPKSRLRTGRVFSSKPRPRELGQSIRIGSSKKQGKKV